MKFYYKKIGEVEPTIFQRFVLKVVWILLMVAGSMYMKNMGHSSKFKMLVGNAPGCDAGTSFTIRKPQAPPPVCSAVEPW